MVIMGDTVQPDPMYFRSIEVCQYYAKSIPKHYGNYSYTNLVPKEHRIAAYCKPIKVDTKDVVIYDH
jgi:hypothetical protein